MVDSNNWQQLETLVQGALAVPAAERSAWLAAHCDGAESLCAEAAALLAFADVSELFLLGSAAAQSARILLNDEQELSRLGQVVGRYKLVREIGRGGMGVVYLAAREDGEFRQQVAIKVVKRGLDTEDILRRFRNERQILAALEHPNIARLFDGGMTADGLPYFVLEYVEGQPLDRYCDGRSLSNIERLQLFRKVCAAVHYAHQNLIVHRDLKPSNILITAAGEPKLLDFGIAKLLNPDLTPFTIPQTATEVRLLTPEYASPEQIRGQKITTASDVYSLGVLLYRLLTGHAPYRVTNLQIKDIERLACDTEPEKPSSAVRRGDGGTRAWRKKKGRKERRGDGEMGRKGDGENPVPAGAPFFSPSPHIPVSPSPLLPFSPSSSSLSPSQLRGDLDNIVLMALRKDPARRYPSALQLSADIQCYLEGLPVLARKDTLVYRTSKFIKRHRVAMVAATVVFLAIVSGLIVAFWQAGNARHERDVARQERAASERINTFLREMLSFSNQSFTSVAPVANTRDVTVNEMLAQITPQVEADLADQPEVRAQVLRTIGSSYASQGRYAAAEKCLRSALATQVQLHGEENSEVAATMVELGVLAYRQMKFAESNQLLGKAVGFYRRQQQSGSPAFNAARLAQALDHWGVTTTYLGEAKKGISLLNEALEIAVNAKLQGNERQVQASIKTNLGGALVLSGEGEKGESYLRQSLAEYRLISSQPHWELGATLLMLGIRELGMGKPAEAEKFLLEGEQIFRRTLGDENTYLANNLVQQAIALTQQGEFKLAEAKAHEALAIRKVIFPKGNLFVAKSSATLGTVLLKAGRFSAAAEYFRQSLAILEQQPAKDFAQIVPAEISLSQSLLAQRRLAEAREVALKAQADVRQNLSTDSRLAKAATENLAKIR